MSLRGILWRLFLEFAGRTDSRVLLPLAKNIANAIVEVPSSSASVSTATPLRVLAINPDRFRGDLQALADTGEVRVFRFPFKWQVRLLMAFYPEHTSLFDYANPAKGTPAWLSKAALRRILPPLLEYVHKRKPFDVVIGAAVHYTQDLDLGEAAEKIGIPYVVLHRESFHASKAAVQGNMARLAQMGRFVGSRIIVHNAGARDTFVQSGYLPAANCIALGVLRMGEYSAKLGSAPRKTHGRPLVAFFSFTHGSGQVALMGNWATPGQPGFVRLFDHVNQAIASLAVRRPDVDFVIKPKWGGDFVRRIESSLQRGGYDLNTLPNLRIDPSVDAQALILQADVVSAFNSTTMLEAAVAGKPVIVPLFEEAAEPQYADWTILKDQLPEVFDIATSDTAYTELIEMRLRQWQPDPRLMQRRRELFEAWISPIDRDVSGDYVQALRAALPVPSFLAKSSTLEVAHS